MAKKATKIVAPSVPKPVKTDERICFGIAFFTSEEDAKLYADDVRRRGLTYNGGFFHGMSCGRDKTWDHEENGVKYYAVTHVKETTGLKTNDKLKQLAKLREMFIEQNAKCTLVSPEGSMPPRWCETCKFPAVRCVCIGGPQ